MCTQIVYTSSHHNQVVCHNGGTGLELPTSVCKQSNLACYSCRITKATSVIVPNTLIT